MRSPSQPWLNRLRCTRWRWSYEHEQHFQTLSIPRDHPFSVVMSFVPAARAAPANTRHSPHANLLLDRLTLMAALQETAAIAARGRILPAAAPGIYYCRSAAAFKMFDLPERLPAHDDMARAARAGWITCSCVDWYLSERCSTRAALYLMPCLGLLRAYKAISMEDHIRICLFNLVLLAKCACAALVLAHVWQVQCP